MADPEKILRTPAEALLVDAVRKCTPQWTHFFDEVVRTFVQGPASGVVTDGAAVYFDGPSGRLVKSGGTGKLPTWQDYPCIFSTSGGASNLGNGTMAARFRWTGPTTVEFLVQMATGTTTTFGGNLFNFTFTLPVPPLKGYENFQGRIFSGAQVLGSMAIANAFAPATSLLFTMTGIQVLATQPWTWASGMYITLGGSYEVAP